MRLVTPELNYTKGPTKLQGEWKGEDRKADCLRIS